MTNETTYSIGYLRMSTSQAVPCTATVQDSPQTELLSGTTDLSAYAILNQCAEEHQLDVEVLIQEYQEGDLTITQISETQIQILRAGGDLTIILIDSV